MRDISTGLLLYHVYLYRLIVNEAVKQFGGIDILILNAAYSPPPTVFTEYENPVRNVVKLNHCYCVYHRVNCSLMSTSEYYCVV